MRAQRLFAALTPLAAIIGAACSPIAGYGVMVTLLRGGKRAVGGLFWGPIVYAAFLIGAGLLLKQLRRPTPWRLGTWSVASASVLVTVWEFLSLQ